MSSGKQGTAMGLEYSPEVVERMNRARKANTQGKTRRQVVARDKRRAGRVNFTPEYREWLERRTTP